MISVRLNKIVRLWVDARGQMSWTQTTKAYRELYDSRQRPKRFVVQALLDDADTGEDR